MFAAVGLGGYVFIFQKFFVGSSFVRGAPARHWRMLCAGLNTRQWDSIMSDDEGYPASRAHVFNGGSQQPRPRTNQPRQEDYTRLHARFRRMCGRREARVAQRRQRWAMVCRDIAAQYQRRHRPHHQNPPSSSAARRLSRQSYALSASTRDFTREL